MTHGFRSSLLTHKHRNTWTPGQHLRFTSRNDTGSRSSCSLISPNGLFRIFHKGLIPSQLGKKQIAKSTRLFAKVNTSVPVLGWGKKVVHKLFYERSADLPENWKETLHLIHPVVFFLFACFLLHVFQRFAKIFKFNYSTVATIGK